MTEPQIIFNQSIEVAVPARSDSPYSSEPVLDFRAEVWREVPFMVSVQPDGSTEEDLQHPVVVSRFVLITPPGTDLPELEAASRVRIGEVMVCDVVGAPARWPDPFTPGRVHHLEATLEVVDG